MAKAKKIEVDGKEYIVCLPTRQDAKNAELYGFNLELISVQPLIQTSKLFYASLKSKQSEISEKESDEILEKYKSEGGDIAEINQFLLNEYMGFFISPNGIKKKKKKQAETIEV